MLKGAFLAWTSCGESSATTESRSCDWFGWVRVSCRFALSSLLAWSFEGLLTLGGRAVDGIFRRPLPSKLSVSTLSPSETGISTCGQQPPVFHGLFVGSTVSNPLHLYRWYLRANRFEWKTSALCWHELKTFPASPLRELQGKVFEARGMVRKTDSNFVAHLFLPDGLKTSTNSPTVILKIWMVVMRIHIIVSCVDPGVRRGVEILYTLLQILHGS